jgi:hypothetical protein
LIDRDVGEHGQRRDARAEVVERQPDARLAQLGQGPPDHIELADRQRLGELEHELFRGRAVRFEPGEHRLRESGVEQAAG